MHVRVRPYAMYVLISMLYRCMHTTGVLVIDRTVRTHHEYTCTHTIMNMFTSLHHLLLLLLASIHTAYTYVRTGTYS